MKPLFQLLLGILCLAGIGILVASDTYLRTVGQGAALFQFFTCFVGLVALGSVEEPVKKKKDKATHSKNNHRSK